MEYDREAFTTARLNVEEYCPVASCVYDDLLDQVVAILSPNVVKSLPPYFSHVTSPQLAQHWLDKVSAESRLFIISHTEQARIIGFLFLYQESLVEPLIQPHRVSEKSDAKQISLAHIGYLLNEVDWGQGYATEFLQGFIAWSKNHPEIAGLIGGVEKDNVASANLLERLDFIAQPSEDITSPVTFYQYSFKSDMS
ncbi:GNAT family N-acetyltransferase [Photobacterium sanguinicancri]|uniref:GNAT family N-acetyltransferase n=1 Tax=Photobacterium sanguinicancri TaxID=875932 RepID=A0AAW7Y7P2_9GAMM|nr:GNAT family N-acetyltransferase [Photobacterium sanguinicancri]MDO6542779.1 GNAT family N-acetyltransferase [Photobacterium sanguinicancri]